MASRTTGITDSGGTTSYSWDYADRLVQITHPDQRINTFTYNGAGARVGKYDSSGTHTYLRTAATPRGDVVDDSAAVYTPSISERRNGVTRFYHFGAHGEKRAETDSAGSPVATFSWDAFGNPTSGSSSTESPFRFFGAWLFETDTDSGFIVSGSVQYDPSTGRSLNPPSRSGASGGAGAGAPGDSAGTTTYLRSGTSVVAPVVADSGGGVHAWHQRAAGNGVAPEPGENVMKVENPFRRELGLPERIYYSLPDLQN